MIKKILIITIMFIFSILLYAPSVHAASVLVPEPASDTGGLWHVEDGNRVYVFMRYTDGSTVIETGDASNSEYPEYDYSLFTYWPSGSESDFDFPNTSLYNDYAAISNPDPTVYDKFVVEIIPNMMAISGPEPSFKIIEEYNTNVDEISIQLSNWSDRENTNYLYDYSYLSLFINGNDILNSRNTNQDVEDSIGLEANPDYLDLSFGVRMYWEKSSTSEVIDPNDPNVDDPWNALPETTGSPVNPIGDWGTVSINVNNQTIALNIEYLGIIYPIQSFIVFGELDFINESNDVLYYTDPNTGDRMLYFNFGETLDSAILAARTFSTVNTWEGEALWNLTQNEIKVTDVLKVYNYIPEVDADGNVYSYFYMPDVPMNSLISVSAILSYRYWSDGFLNIGELEPGEIRYKAVAAVRGETTSVNPTWVEDTYKSAYIFGGVAAVATATVSFIPVYGWGVAGASFLIGGALQASDMNEWFAYDVEQIQHVIPSIALANEINTYISDQDGTDQFTADTDKLYKLHLAVLQDEDDVEIMEDLSNVTQIVWETDGEIYVVNEENIANPDWGGPGTLIPANDIGNDDLEILLYVGLGIAGLYIISQLKLDKKPGLMVLIIAAALYILYEMGLL